MQGQSADSLLDVLWGVEATPGLQQLARVLAIQLQVLNGADDLCMHVSDHITNVYPVRSGKERAVQEEEGGGEKKNSIGKKGKNEEGEKKTPQSRA